MLDYDLLRIIWWLLLGVLLAGIAIMDGYDLGVGSVLPFIAKNDNERRVVINSMGPYWESNQVWIILGGGAIFAAWPIAYAMSFSGFYFAMFVLLSCLIIRPICFKFRYKLETQKARNLCDWGLFTAGVVPAVIFGVAVGNIFLGANFSIDNEFRLSYSGSGLFELLHPYALLCGLVALSMSIMQGTVYLTCKVDKLIANRAIYIAKISGAITIILFIIGGLLLPLISGYKITSPIADNYISNPLNKTVEVVPGAWFAHLTANPVLFIIPAIAIIAIIITIQLVDRAPKTAMITSSTGIAFIVATAGATVFPFIMPSSIEPNHSLTVWDSSSSHLTLNIMFWATLIGMPIVIGYIIWVIRAMRGRIDIQDIVNDTNNHY